MSVITVQQFYRSYKNAPADFLSVLGKFVDQNADAGIIKFNNGQYVFSDNNELACKVVPSTYSEEWEVSDRFIKMVCITFNITSSKKKFIHKVPFAVTIIALFILMYFACWALLNGLALGILSLFGLMLAYSPDVSFTTMIQQVWVTEGFKFLSFVIMFVLSLLCFPLVGTNIDEIVRDLYKDE